MEKKKKHFFKGFVKKMHCVAPSDNVYIQIYRNCCHSNRIPLDLCLQGYILLLEVLIVVQVLADYAFSRVTEDSAITCYAYFCYVKCVISMLADCSFPLRQ